MNGKLIVIEGLDGSGKATQANLLYEDLKKQGQKVEKVSFPNYKEDSSALIKMYLAGEFGEDPEDVNAYAASSFYAVDRYASYKKDWGKFYADGDIIVADRYTTSNVIHQCGKKKSGWDEFIEWLFQYEYELLGIPKPDIVIYLQMDTEISQKLMSNRYQGDEERKDIHERNIEYLNRSKAVAEYCAEKLEWKTVHCIRNGIMRSIDDIHKEIMDILERDLK